MAIRFDDNVFAKRAEGYGSNETIKIETSSPEAAVSALERSGRRFMAVDELGHEHDESTISEVYGELYFPNWVSPVRRLADGACVYVDCKSEIKPPMRETFICILRDELTAAGIDTAVVIAAPDGLWIEDS